MKALLFHVHNWLGISRLLQARLLIWVAGQDPPKEMFCWIWGCVFCQFPAMLALSFQTRRIQTAIVRKCGVADRI